MKKSLCLLLLAFIVSVSSFSQAFVHPGILHTQSDFDRMAKKVNAGEEPYLGSYELLVNSSEAQLSWNPRATATIIRGGTGDNVALLYRDVQAAYQHALLWKITGNTNHGNKARDILNSWSAIHTTLTGTADRYLASGIFGYQFANAAEMMRGYSGFDLGRFQNYMLNVYYYPLVERFLIGNDQFGRDHNDACISNYWANWDLCNMAAMVAIGVLCDNRDIYNKGIEYFKGNLEYFKNHPVYARGRLGNGTVREAVPFIHSQYHGQWQESGRDQGHSLLGVGLMASFCEIAWNQGDDMYGYDDNRFRKGAEYVAKYNMGQEVPFTTYSWGSGTTCAYNQQTVISNAGRGEARPIWEMIYNHYTNRVGQGADIGYITAFAAQQRPEWGPGGHATTYDQPGFGSLTHYGDDASGGSIVLVTGVSGITGTFQLKNRGTGLVIDGYGLTGNEDPVRQYASSTTHPNSQWEIIDAGSTNGSFYYLKNVGTGMKMDGLGRTINGDDAGQYESSTTHINSQWVIQQYNGYYRLQNRGTGLFLDGLGRTANGEAVGQYANTSHVNAQWELIPITGNTGVSFNGSVVQLKNRGTGLVADGYGNAENGDPVNQYASSTTHPNSHWEMINVNSSEGTFYYLKNVGTGMKMDGYGRTENGSDVAQYNSSTTHINAQWIVEQYEGSYYRISNRGTGLFLDGMGHTANGEALGQYANTSHVNAQWEIVIISSLKSCPLNKHYPVDNLLTDINISPNPVTSVLYFDLPDDFENGYVEIIDLSGRRLIKDDISKIKTNINVNTLEAGIYIVRITNGAEKSWSEKIIKK
ncbi:MAG: RICIN domain-containing protein [Marinilabiliaceae bacterium]|nr:RICIN domain-containing protein [Marinilabiliaceae bacterium]